MTSTRSTDLSLSKPGPSFAEFVMLVSLLMALTALSIDAMLPALAQIGAELNVSADNDRQLVVSTIFIGMSIGQLFFGPLSDSIGRKRPIYLGLLLYLAGSALSLLAFTFPLMLIGRLLQGGGVAAPRAVTLALVRDRYAGRAMARVLSFAMTVFILIPMIAPTVGQAILKVAGWRAIFGCFILMALSLLLWFGVRMPETLPADRRTTFTWPRMKHTVRDILQTRATLGYTVTAGLVSGAFIGYLNSSQQIFQELYALGDRFPLVFAVLAGAVGLASLFNARLVLRFGMRWLVNRALRGMLLLSLATLFLALTNVGVPALWLLLVCLLPIFFCIGILFGNMNALAMEPLGHAAGVGSALVGSLSTLVSVVIGTLIGQQYDGTIVPLLIGMAFLSALSLAVVRWIDTADDPLPSPYVGDDMTPR